MGRWTEALIAGCWKALLKGQIMAKSAVVFVANGCEPVEVVAPVDALRRGGVDVVLAAVSDDLTVRAAQAVTLQADAPLSTLDLTQFDIAIVPGGSVGVDNLGKSQRVVAELAGPMVLANAGLLTGRKAVCYPGCEEGWPADIYQAGKDVFVDGNLITATGPGTALSFGIQILRTLEGDKVADEVASGMLLK